jgi:hypothetical protein
MSDKDLIDLDTLLHGKPTWEEVVAFWKVDGDFCEEQYLVAAIEKHLLTEEQRKLMFDHHLSIEKMLNGRYVGGAEVSAAVGRIYDEWNAKLGFEAFGA